MTLHEDELALVTRLRDAIGHERPLATFMADLVVAAAEAELHGMECQCHEMAQVLYNWSPAGQPN